MAGRREEAAPTFGTWKQRLADAPESERAALVEQFRGMLTVLGTPMIEEPFVHFIHYDAYATDVRLIGEMNQWNEEGLARTPLVDTGIFSAGWNFTDPPIKDKTYTNNLCLPRKDHISFSSEIHSSGMNKSPYVSGPDKLYCCL
jgi:hypothetical protein